MNYLSYYYLIELIHQCSCSVVGDANDIVILISMFNTSCGATYISVINTIIINYGSYHECS